MLANRVRNDDDLKTITDALGEDHELIVIPEDPVSPRPTERNGADRPRPESPGSRRSSGSRTASPARPSGVAPAPATPARLRQMPWPAVPMR